MTLDPFIIEQLKQSFKIVGPLSSVVKCKQHPQVVLSGAHRSKAAGDRIIPETLFDVDELASKLKCSHEVAELVVKHHANIQRQISREERTEEFALWAKQFTSEGMQKGEIAESVSNFTNFSEAYVRELLPPQYKDPVKAAAGKVGGEVSMQQQGAQLNQAPETIMSSKSFTPSAEQLQESGLSRRLRKDGTVVYTTGRGTAYTEESARGMFPKAFEDPMKRQKRLQRYEESFEQATTMIEPESRKNEPFSKGVSPTASSTSVKTFKKFAVRLSDALTSAGLANTLEKPFEREGETTKDGKTKTYSVDIALNDYAICFEAEGEGSASSDNEERDEWLREHEGYSLVHLPNMMIAQYAGEIAEMVAVLLAGRHEE